MTIVTKPCSQCGNSVDLDTTGWPEKAVETALAFASVGMFCDPCSAAADLAEDKARADGLQVRAAELWETRLKESKVQKLPADFAWPDGAAGEAAAAWARGEIKTLTLHGPAGTGKTTLAKAAFRHRLRPQVRGPLPSDIVAPRGAWRGAAGLVIRLGADFGTEPKGDIVELASGQLIVGLDDLDKARPSAFAAEAIYAVIDAAYDAGRSVIVTSNRPLGDIAQRWSGKDGAEATGEAIASRLAEGTVVFVDGADRRLEGKS